MNAEKIQAYITKDTAATELDTSTRTIDRYLERGELKKFKFGQKVLILREEFEEFKKRRVIAEAI